MKTDKIREKILNSDITMGEALLKSKDAYAFAKKWEGVKTLFGYGVFVNGITTFAMGLANALAENATIASPLTIGLLVKFGLDTATAITWLASYRKAETSAKKALAYREKYDELVALHGVQYAEIAEENLEIPDETEA